MLRNGVALSLVSIASMTLGAEELTLAPITVESSTIMDLNVSEELKTEPSTINYIGEKTYQMIDPKNINEVLRTVPGITADVRTGDTVEIHIRGVNQQEFMWEDTGVAVVIDGVPVMQNGGKVKINLDNIESIKVIKGGASYLYGPNALAGAVVITTKKPKNMDEIDVSADYGSYAYQNYQFTYNKATDRFAAILNGSYRYTSGYWDMTKNWTGSGNGKFTWYIDETSDITFGAEYTRKYEESSRGSVTGFSAAYEDPTGASDGDLPWNHDYWSDIQKYFVNYNKDFADGGNLLVNAYYYQDLYNYDSSPQDLNGDGQEDTYTLNNDEDIDQYGLKAEYRNSYGNFGYMIGLDTGRRELDDSWDRTATYSVYNRWTHKLETYYKGESSSSDTTEDRLGLYAEGKYQATEALTLIANLRYDYERYTYDVNAHDYNGTVWQDDHRSASDSFNNLSWRLGFTYQLTENHTLYSSVSTGFRNPRIQDIYAGDFDPDTYLNNPDLDTETTINYEIGFRGNFSFFDTDFGYEASVYQLDTKDIIGKEYGTYYWGSPVWGGKSFYDNVGDARTRGFELALHSDRTRRLSFDLAYTYMDAKYTSHKPFYVALAGPDSSYDITGNRLPRTPRHRFDLLTYYKVTDDWTLIAENYLQSSYFADETNEVRVPGYGIMNLQLRYRTTFRENPLEFYVRADNIFDRHYFRTVYLYRDRNNDGKLDREDASITVDPGRVYYVGVKYKF